MPITGLKDRICSTNVLLSALCNDGYDVDDVVLNAFFLLDTKFFLVNNHG